MDEFERSVLAKFPDFPGYRAGEQSPENAREWYTAYQRLVEWLHERSGDGAVVRRARELMGTGSGIDMLEASRLLGVGADGDKTA